MAGIQADWVGKTPEEYYGEKEYKVEFTLTGTTTVYARSKEEAIEKAYEISVTDLIDDVEDKEFN